MTIPARGCVLVVDDDALLRRALCHMLARRGYAVVEARDPHDAIAIAERGDRIDVVLTDIEMPGMNGFALAARLRERAPTLRILYMSGAIERAPDGAHVLGKPFDVAALEAAMRAALG